MQGYPAAGTLDDVLGLEIYEANADRCRGGFEAEPRVHQPYGIVHGGAYAALAEAMASWATAVGVGREDRLVVGQSNSTNFLRPVQSGRIEAEGTPRHRGRTSWIWDVEFTGPNGKPCAISRVTLAVRERDQITAAPADDAGAPPS